MIKYILVFLALAVLALGVLLFPERTSGAPPPAPPADTPGLLVYEKTLLPRSNGTNVAYPLGTWDMWAETDFWNGTDSEVSITMNVREPNEDNYIYSVEGVVLKSPTGAGDVRIEWNPGQYIYHNRGYGPHHMGQIAVFEAVPMGNYQWTYGRDNAAFHTFSLGGLTNDMYSRTQAIWPHNVPGLYSYHVWGYYWKHDALGSDTGPIRP